MTSNIERLLVFSKGGMAFTADVPRRIMHYFGANDFQNSSGCICMVSVTHLETSQVSQMELSPEISNA